MEPGPIVLQDAHATPTQRPASSAGEEPVWRIIAVQPGQGMGFVTAGASLMIQTAKHLAATPIAQRGRRVVAVQVHVALANVASLEAAPPAARFLRKNVKVTKVARRNLVMNPDMSSARKLHTLIAA